MIKTMVHADVLFKLCDPPLFFQVLHSQSLSEKPLQPWIIIQKDGTVESAHCNCMAGLGESCTHVAATLFALDAAVKYRNNKTVTEDKAYWLPAASKKASIIKTTLNNTGNCF